MQKYQKSRGTPDVKLSCIFVIPYALEMISYFFPITYKTYLLSIFHYACVTHLRLKYENIFIC